MVSVESAGDCTGHKDERFASFAGTSPTTWEAVSCLRHPGRDLELALRIHGEGRIDFVLTDTGFPC